MLHVQPAHQGIARRLGENGGGRNGQALAVAFYDRLLRQGQVLYAPRVNEHMLGRA